MVEWVLEVRHQVLQTLEVKDCREFVGLITERTLVTSIHFNGSTDPSSLDRWNLATNVPHLKGKRPTIDR